MSKVKSKKSTKTVKKITVVGENQIRKIASELAKRPVEKNLVDQRDRVVNAINKLADRVHSNAVKVQKTAEREATKAVREKAKAIRNAKKTAKRQAKIASLKKQLEKMEAALAAESKKS